MQYNKFMNKRKDTYSVEVGNIKIGSKHPIRVQSMTNTLHWHSTLFVNGYSIDSFCIGTKAVQ